MENGLLEGIEAKENTSTLTNEVVIGLLTGLNELGIPQVDFPGNTTDNSISAMTTTPLSQKHTGRKVALLFANNDLERPIILGLIAETNEDFGESFPSNTVVEENAEAILDGERIEFSAEKEIVLRCGKASITLTKAGKILLRGTYLLSYSSGVNRIKGGSIQLN